MLFPGVTTSNPAPSNNDVSPGVGLPRKSAACRAHVVPATVIIRPSLVWPPALTVTGPHTASAGTVTVREPGAAAVTVPAVVPVSERKRTLFNAGDESKPRPVSVTLLPRATFENGDTLINASPA